jgi:hypothetical protein
VYLNHGKQKVIAHMCVDPESLPTEPSKQPMGVKRSSVTDTDDQSRRSSRTTRGDVEKEVGSWSHCS